MTQKDKLMRAIMFAQRVKSIAHSLEFEMKSYDCTWPRPYIEQLGNAADSFLNLK